MRIAVVGTGISGLGAAWLLAPKHDVRVFEREPRIGGHTHTHRVSGARGAVAVDSGFIVYNETTYPLLTTLFGALGVRSQPIDMSFSFECERCRVVYSGLGIGGVFADPVNALRPGFLRFLGVIGRFNRSGRRVSAARLAGPAATLKDLVGQTGPDVLGRHYAYPLASALWSTGIPVVQRFPAATFVDFLRRHRLFQLRGRLQRLDQATPWLVTLIPSRRPARVHDRVTSSFGTPSPRALRPRSTAAHDSADSRKPGATARTSLVPSAMAPITTSRAALSFSMPAFT